MSGEMSGCHAGRLPGPALKAGGDDLKDGVIGREK